MTDKTPELMSFDQARSRLRELSVVHEEVPVEHEVSLPLPTLRFRRPAWTCFAAPAMRRPGETRVSVPDRYWAVDARDRHLLVYALQTALPIFVSATQENPAVPLTLTARTLDELRTLLESAAVALDRVCTRFLEGREAPPSNRRAAAQAFAAAVPPELLRWHRVLSDDFFNWLDH